MRMRATLPTGRRASRLLTAGAWQFLLRLGFAAAERIPL
jgi:hypothetical protein